MAVATLFTPTGYGSDMSSGEQEPAVDSLVFATTLIAALEIRIKDAAKLQSNPKAMRSIEERIRSPELLQLATIDEELKTNRNNDTPLILAVRTGDLSLVKYFAEHSDNSARGCESCAYASMSTVDLLSHRNNRKENALLIAEKLCLSFGIHAAAFRNSSIPRRPTYQPDSVFSYLLKLAIRHCQTSTVFYQTTELRQSLLHQAFSQVCQHCEDFCVARYLLKMLKTGNVSIDPRQEDNKHYTPLFYLLKRGNEEPDTQADELGEDSALVRRQRRLVGELREYSAMCGVPWVEMLVNSRGMDIAHVCASCNSIQFLVNHLIDDLSPDNGVHLLLYGNEPAEFDSQLVLGGPIEDRSDANSRSLRYALPQPPKHRLWTALHFACNGGHSESMAYLIQCGFNLQDCTRDGRTCTDLVFTKPDRQEALLNAFQIVSEAAEGRVGPLGRSWILEYATCVDSVRCALDSCEGDGEQAAETTAAVQTEAAADAELCEAWRIFKKSQKYRGLTSLDDMTVKSLMYMCFENDSATEYRALLHSSYWRRATGNPRVFGFQESESTVVDEQLPDRDFIKFFLKVMGELPEMEAEVPKKGRLGLKVDFMWWTFEGLSLDRRQSNAVSQRPLFTYRDNGKIFLRKLDKPTSYFRLLSLVDLAIITGRSTMAKALIITRQFDVIPTAVAAIVRCNRLIRQEHLINYYPIRDTNLELKSVKAFAARVAINAIDVLFRGCRDRDAELVFEYLLGKMSTHDGSGREFALPASKLMVRKLELKQGKELSQDLSAMELIRKCENVDFYGTACIQQLVQRLWHEPPEYHSSDFDNIYEAASRSSLTNLSVKPKDDTFYNVKSYLQCPRRRLILYGVSTILYIGLLITSLTNPSVAWNWTDVVLLFFLVSFVIQESHECLIRTTTTGEGIRSYLFNIWSVYDLLNIIFLLSAFIYKAAIRNGQWGDLDDHDATKLGGSESVYHHFYYKVLMSMPLILVSARFLKTLRFARSTGVNIVILPYIFYRDLMPFVIILFLMIISFGTVFQSLLSVGRYKFDGTSVSRRNDSVLFEIYTRPLLNAFGDFQLDALDYCNTEEGCYFSYAKLVYKRFVLLIFLLLVNLVMFNMLIAKFSNTVSRSEQRWQLIWLALRHELLIDYCRLSSWPPPLSFVGILWLLIVHCSQGACRLCRKPDLEQENRRLALLGRNHERFLLRQADRFRRMRHRMQTRDVEHIQDDIEEELLGDTVNWSGARIQFDRAKQTASSASVSAADAMSKKLDELLRRSKRKTIDDDDAFTSTL